MKSGSLEDDSDREIDSLCFGAALRAGRRRIFVHALHDLEFIVTFDALITVDWHFSPRLAINR